MEIPAQEHAGMTEGVHAGMTEGVHAWMTEGVHAWMMEEERAWTTVEVYAGMTVYFRPRNYTLSPRPPSRDLLIALTQLK